MILALDTGLATFGWAIVAPRTGAVSACGVLLQKPNPKLGKHDDRLRRVTAQAHLLNDLIRTWKVWCVAAEEMSFAPRSSATAKIGIGLSWGNVVGLASAYSARFIVIPPKTWQRAIVPAKVGEKETAAIPYELVFKALTEFVDLKATGLDKIANGLRNHALDAVGIGVFAALKRINVPRETPATTEAA